MRKLHTANIILFWGALWGICEATIGYLLHLLPIKIGYMFYFPIALFFMERAYKSSQKLYSVLFTGCFAALIKLVNLFMEVRIDRVINPALSIILEALTVFTVYYIFNRLHSENKLVKAVSVSFSWRVLYLVYLLFVPLWMYNISALSGRNLLIKFLLIESAVNALTIFVYYIIQSAVNKKKSVPRKTNFAFMAPMTIFLIAADIIATLYL